MRCFRGKLAMVLAAASVLVSGCSLFDNSKLVGFPGSVKLTGATDPVQPPPKPVSPEGVAGASAGSPQAKAAADQNKSPVRSPASPQNPAPPPTRQPGDQTSPVAAPPPPPRAVAPSQPVLRYRNATLSEDVRWSGEVLVEGGVTVASQATLTVEPGTVVRFGASGDTEGTHSVLLVFGRIVVAGTPERPVLLTSRYAEPRPSDWQGIVFMGSEKKNSIEHCRIEGAETGIDAAFSSLATKNTVFAGCAVGARFADSLVSLAGGGPFKCGTGIAASDSELDLRDGEIKGNRQGIVAARTSLSVSSALFAGNESEALQASGSRVKILNSNFEMNGAGMLIADTEGTVSYNRIRENADYGISLVKARLKVSGNEVSSNGRIGMRVEECHCAIWNNAIHANGTADLYNAGAGDVRVIGNWWGSGTPAEIEKRLVGRQQDAALGRIVITPVLAGNPLSP